MESGKRIIALVLCICSILALCLMPVSIAKAIEYSTYDGPFFTVEYPTGWQTSGGTTAFLFFDENKEHYINISTSDNYPVIKIMNDYTTFANGTFDDQTMHFINTLKFKSHLTGQINDNKANKEEQNASYWLQVGLDLENQSKYDEAVQAYNKAINLNEYDADAWYLKGVALGMKDKYEEALQAFDQAIEIDPQYTYAWSGKAMILNALGRTGEADEAYAKAKELGYTG